MRFLPTLLFLLFVVPAGQAYAAQILRVGVFDNQPLVFKDQQGKVTGFMVELLEHIAQKNNWQIEYRFDAWSNQLAALERQEIDLLVGIAYSEERAQKFDFCTQTAINNWGVVIQASTQHFTSLQDLTDKKIALMQRSIHAKAFIETMSNFGFQFTAVEVQDYQGTFDAVHNGKADAAVVNRVFSLLHKDKQDLKETGIILNPVEVRYAAPKGHMPEIIQQIDQALATAKSNANSFYYRILNKWLGGTERTQNEYQWLMWAVIVIITLLSLVIFYNYLLSRQVKTRTRELAASEQRYRLAQQAARIGSWEWDLETNQVYWSENIASMFGLKPQEFDGKYESYLAMLEPEVREDVIRTIDAALINKHEYVIEHKIIWPDGSAHWISGRGKALYAADGKPISMVGVVQDITHKKQTENTLRESEERFRQLAENIKVVFWIGSADWQKVEYVSPAYEIIWGRSCASLYADPLSWLAAIHPDDRAQVEEDVREKVLYPVKKPEFRDYRILRPDNTVRWIAARAYPIFDKKGEVYRIAGIAEDVTERIEAEAELENHRHHLEEMVRERTYEYETINKELESFSYAVSHDLRAPLRAIDGFSDALREDYANVLDATGKEYLNRVRNAAQRMSVLIDDLLHLSRVTRADLEKNTINISQLVTETIRRYSENDDLQKVDFKVQENLFVQADKRLLEIAISNLIDNAIKYSRKSPHPKIEFGSESKNGRLIYFVKDNGAGFDMRYVSKLFTPFQRLHNPSEFEGAGVGLATVKRIITRHGGEVWAESSEGQGAAFYFTL